MEQTCETLQLFKSRRPILSHSLLLPESKEEEQMSLKSQIVTLVDMPTSKGTEETSQHALWLLLTAPQPRRPRGVGFLHKLCPQIVTVCFVFFYLPLILSVHT